MTNPDLKYWRLANQISINQRQMQGPCSAANHQEYHYAWTIWRL